MEYQEKRKQDSAASTPSGSRTRSIANMEIQPAPLEWSPIDAEEEDPWCLPPIAEIR